MNVKECFKDGLLRREKINKERIRGSLKLSEKFLKNGKKIFETKCFDMVFLAIYNSMFHAARALLFKDGITERSHFCFIKYLTEKHWNRKDVLDMLNTLDGYRIIRHRIQYDGRIVDKESTKEAMKDAEKFLKIVKNVIK